jgi:hypothetical protein
MACEPVCRYGGWLMLRRVSVLIGTVSTLGVIASGPAFASFWGGVDCEQAPYAGCQVQAGQGRQPGDAPSRPQRPSSGGRETGPPPAQGDESQGDSGADCQYVRSDYQPPSQGSATIAYHPRNGTVRATRALYRTQQPGERGAWYLYRCSGQGGRDSAYRPPMWIPDGQGATPSPQELARQAYERLRLPTPEIHASPSGRQLVNLPTWLWLNQDGWHPQKATASVPGVSVTAMAVPQWMSWDMGDGAVVTCVGPGRPFPVGENPRSISPDCGHTYRQGSQGRPNNAYPVVVTVHWTVTWSGAGQGGTFPGLTSISAAEFTVDESQALNQLRN